MTKKTVRVTQEIWVQVDESKFTPDFLKEFRETMYNFPDINDHIEHLAQLKARGIITHKNQFVEGYGNLLDMGIILIERDLETEIF